ncbi:MAG: rhomboid family intramembrane serine protease [Saprospiraceae bacterium]|nr:rhomboid family intramembrane serine protease [Saprospiraceae bacterium]
METTGTVGTILMILTLFISYKGFKDHRFFEDYLFEVDKILMRKEYKRLFTSGFLHADWIHFGFNMIALLSFSWSLELMFGHLKFLFLYFGSMLGGSLLALWVHRNHGDYRAIGASGAISGVIMSSIILFPQGSISLIFIPIPIKSWLFGLLFILISIFGIKNKRDNIGHEAHLGGAITGVLITLIIAPWVLKENWWIVLAILIPVTAFLMLIVRNPAVLMVDNYWGENVKSVQKRTAKIRSIKSPSRKDKEKELDELLEKIRKHGMNNLSKKEKERLDELKDDL